MSQPQKIQISSVKPRATRVAGAKRYITRWRVDTTPHSRTFATKAQADDLHSRLIQARREGQRFDPETGLPSSLSGSTETFFEHTASWLAAEWGTWAVRTRRSAIEQAVAAVVLVTPPGATTPPPAIYTYLSRSLNPELDEATARQEVPTWKECERWLRRNSLPLARLDAMTARRLRNGLAHRRDPSNLTPLSANMLNRLRTGAHQIILRAVDDNKMPSDPWPRSASGRTRVSEKVDHTVNVEALPSAQEVRKVIELMASNKPESAKYQLLTEFTWMLGTRPGEARAIHAEDLTLPEEGWGAAYIHRADSGDGKIGPTKTGATRTVPVPPPLVTKLRTWLDGRTTGLLVASPSGGLVDDANWRRALRRGASQAGIAVFPPLHLRHCCATTWLNLGAHPPMVAERLGHTLEMLHKHYWKVMRGDEDQMNLLLERHLDTLE